MLLSCRLLVKKWRRERSRLPRGYTAGAELRTALEINAGFERIGLHAGSDAKLRSTA
jgi:hypothetical protein